ncbi:MAG: twin-arginine translocase TatA/TatE family subunit [Opitutaceae bacterium]|jgi:sec-independent protein translocase protein TatA|nr:twin-arginine translocase TatA/TatE family subunit [Opitutaceae bacterium]|tara:strand:- start:158 stop:424 length:267 start_codon:yes stop_codon:yes gene_type:complete
METPYSLAFIQNLNWTEVVVILIVFILLFGAKKLPELARGIGKSIKEFKKATSTIEEDIRTAMDEEPEVKKSINTEKATEAKEETPSQ